MATNFFLMLISASALPLLAVVALSLRRNLFTGKTKVLLMFLGFLLLSYAVFETIREHHASLGGKDVLVAFITACITYFILSTFKHTHTHNQEEAGAKGIVVSEAFHSLIDGAVIGATFIVNPLLGTAATLGIIVHELPKIVGTLVLLRGLGLSIKKTMLYGALAQGGAPIAATLIYLLGTHVSEESFQGLEIASISSLGVIVLWIIYLEIKHHLKHDHKH